METFGDKVRKDIGYTREIPIKFPLDVYKEFSTFAKEEAGDCYWLAIKRLLSEKKSNDRYNKLDDRISKVEGVVVTMIGPSEEQDEEIVKTFGKKKGDEK